MQATFLGTFLPGLLSVGLTSSSGWSSMLPPPTRWTEDDMPDLTGKVMIVTGGNAGVGRETVRALLVHKARVYLAGRNQEKCMKGIQGLKEETGHDALWLPLDLANLESVKAAANEFKSKETQLHVLFNNAAAQYPDVEDITAQGYDMQFGTNVIGHFYFTKLLLPVLLDTAKSSLDGRARVIHVSSVGHEFVTGINFDTLKDSLERMTYHTTKLYFQSKFGNVVVSNEFHKRYADQGLVSLSLHPGNLKYDMERHSSLGIRILSVINPLLPDSKQGALTQLWAGTMPEGVELGGKYCMPWARVGSAKPQTDDNELGQRLWAWLEDEVKKFESR